jgi:hypothetical protein
MRRMPELLMKPANILSEFNSMFNLHGANQMFNNRRRHVNTEDIEHSMFINESDLIFKLLPVNIVKQVPFNFNIKIAVAPDLGEDRLCRVQARINLCTGTRSLRALLIGAWHVDRGRLHGAPAWTSAGTAFEPTRYARTQAALQGRH